MTFSIASLSLYRQTSSSVGRLQADLARVSEELASGKKADVAGDLGTGTAPLVDMRLRFERAEAHVAAIEAFDRRADLMQLGMKDLAGNVQEAVKLLSGAAADYNELSISLPDMARQTLEGMVETLNVSDGGGFVFSGVASDRRPMVAPAEGVPSPLDQVQAAAVPYPPATIADAQALTAAFDGLFAPGAFDTVFYRGAPNGAGDPRPQVRFGDGATAEIAVQGNDAAFRDVMQGLYMLATVDPADFPTDPEPPLTAADDRNSPYWSFMGDALDRLSAGLDALGEMQATLGLQQERAAQAKGRHEAYQVLLGKQIVKMEEADPYETQVRFTSIQTQLEASYQITARLTGLSLTNFLR